MGLVATWRALPARYPVNSIHRRLRSTRHSQLLAFRQGFTSTLIQDSNPLESCTIVSTFQHILLMKPHLIPQTAHVHKSQVVFQLYIWREETALRKAIKFILQKVRGSKPSLINARLELTESIFGLRLDTVLP